MYKRTLEKVIKKVTAHFPVLLLTGARQVGKTTLLQNCKKKNQEYVTLDDLDIRQLAKNDPALFFQRYKPPIIIDEIQYAPELLSYIKIIVDKENKNGLFWLTGSQKFHLMKGITESLAGRVAIINLFGLSKSELENRWEEPQFIPTMEWIEEKRNLKLQSTDIKKVYNQIWYGAFPKVNIKKDPLLRQIFYSSYIKTYLQRDVKDILNISNENTFYNFIVSVAAHTGQLLNYAELSRDIGIDNKTVKAWLSILESSGIIYILKPYYSNILKRLIKTPKVYFLDTGLCSYLTKWPDADSLEAGAMSGAMLETYLITEILKSYYHNGIEPNFYYYRDNDQKEIDLLIETGNSVYPIEFKKTATPSQVKVNNFSYLKKLSKKIEHGIILCFVEKDIPLTKDISAIPINYL